jgi:hypothetical protein
MERPNDERVEVEAWPRGEEALLVLCDESKRSRLEEYLASPVFGCQPIAPSDFQRPPQAANSTQLQNASSVAAGPAQVRSLLSFIYLFI